MDKERYFEGVRKFSRNEMSVVGRTVGVETAIVAAWRRNDPANTSLPFIGTAEQKLSSFYLSTISLRHTDRRSYPGLLAMSSSAQSSKGSNNSIGPAGQAPPSSPKPHLSNLTSLPEARQQSYEEIYGPPENLLEIEVRLRQSHATTPLISAPTACRSFD